MLRVRLRSERLRVIVVVALLLLATGVYYVMQRGKLGDVGLATDKTLLMVMAVLLLLLAVGLAWVMIRNLARVVAARRRGVIGSKLQARVAFAFLSLVLIPSLTLFGGAVAFVSGTLKSLVSPEIKAAVEREKGLADAVYEHSREQADRATTKLVAELLGVLPSVEGAAQEIEHLRSELGMFAAGVGSETGASAVAWNSGRLSRDELRESELAHVAAQATALARSAGRRAVFEERLAFGWIVVSAEPWAREADGLVAWTAMYLPEELVRRLEPAARAAAEARGFDRRRPALQRFYIVLFTLLTMLVLFAAVWTGLYLARQITDPILDLSRGTRALTRGELSYRVEEGARDEIGFLARSFNRMAAEIQRQRRALTRRRRYIETLLETVPVGVMSLSTEGRVSTANREAMRVLGIERLHPGRPIDEVLGPGGAEIGDLIRPILAGKSIRVRAEASVVRGDDSTLVALTAERFGISEDEDAVLVVVEDLTQLRKAERLAAWGEVARRVAHEIKNPLTPIRLAAERMRRRYRIDAAEAENVIEEGSATIVREVLSLKSMVDEFSHFARLPEVVPRRGNLNEVVHEAVALYTQAHASVRIVERLASRLPEHLIDEEAIRRCLINLFENSAQAIAHSKRDGTIGVTTRANAAGDTISLEVVDDGPGIRATDKEQLFLPTFSRRPGGTGLGLAIVHRIVGDHGGSIRAEDAPRGGTRIIIELPSVSAAVRGSARSDHSQGEAPS